MHIAHLTTTVATHAGGTANSIPGLCQSLTRRSGLRLTLIAGGLDARDPHYELQSINLIHCRAKSFSDTYAKLDRLHAVSPIDVLHDHGQWMPFNFASAVFAKHRGIPRLASPHGMLSDQARRHRGLKKRIAWLAYARWSLCQADVLHATSDLEAADLRRLSPRPTVVLPNGIEVPGDQASLVSRPRRQTVAFLGRMHRIKGVPTLLNAWERARPKGWRLKLAGPDEEGVFAHGVPPNVEYLGSLKYEEKFDFLSDASLLVLPSLSENFGLVVAESLYAGTPVIASRGTPWQSLEQYGCGWWVDSDVETLAETLQRAVATPQQQLREMGSRGSIFAAATFPWPRVGDRYEGIYAHTRDIHRERCGVRRKAAKVK